MQQIIKMLNEHVQILVSEALNPRKIRRAKGPRRVRPVLAMGTERAIIFVLILPSLVGRSVSGIRLVSLGSAIIFAFVSCEPPGLSVIS